MENLVETNKKPKYLYHYTSIENFALILKNRTIRFNSLNNVDDTTEAGNKESEKVGSYFFVSCWTDDSRESLPFWNMYTPQMRGVRIRLPLNIFKLHKIEVNWVKGYKPGIYKSIVPEEKTRGRNFWIIPTVNESLHKITYTDNYDKLYPKIRGTEFNKFNLETIGLFKHKIWEFQSEWRYIIRAYPKPDVDILAKWNDTDEFNPLQFSPRNVRQPIALEEIYLNIIESKFKKMEIMLGPKHSDADYEIVRSLLQVHNPEALNSLKGSELKGKIR